MVGRTIEQVGLKRILEPKTDELRADSVVEVTQLLCASVLAITFGVKKPLMHRSGNTRFKINVLKWDSAKLCGIPMRSCTLRGTLKLVHRSMYDRLSLTPRAPCTCVQLLPKTVRKLYLCLTNTVSFFLNKNFNVLLIFLGMKRG